MGVGDQYSLGTSISHAALIAKVSSKTSIKGTVQKEKGI